MQMKKYILILLYFWNGCKSVLKPVTENRMENYLTDCILSISTTYFNKKLPVLIQTPSVRRNKDFQIGKKLFQMLQSEQIFSHIVFSISGSSKKIKITKPGSYIIILPPLLTYNDMHKTLQMYESIKQNAHQPKGKLLVVATQKTAIPASMVYSQVSLNYGFSNVVVIEPAFARSNINIFSWDVNEQMNICSGEIDNTRHSDIWISKKKKFLHEINLYPLYNRINLRGCLVNASLSPLAPLIYFCYKRNNPSEYLLTYDGLKMCGVFIRFLISLKQCLNFKITIYNKTNHRHRNFNFPTVLDSKHEWRACESTYPHFRYDFTWMVPSGKEIPRWQSLFRVFDAVIWFLIILTLSFGILTMWLLQKSPRHWSASSSTFDTVIISALLTHLGVGITERYKGFVASLFFSLWLYYCALINTLYQSKYFRLLVDPEVLPPIKSAKELENSGLILATGVHLKDDAEIWKYINNCEFIRYITPFISKLATDRKHAFFTHLWEANRISNHYRDSRGKPQIIAIDKHVAAVLILMEFRKLPCVFLDIIDSIMYMVFETGLIGKWLEDETWIMTYPHYLSPDVVRVFSFSLLQLQGAFYLLLLGVVISSFVFIIEIVFTLFRNSLIKKRFQSSMRN
ncbi:Ionotropic receptor 344 [Blattella germanica]|nr:Ionotropic receptor 344 [Blattella germanica]